MRVDETNLQRQILYGTPDVGRPKLDAAAERLRAINPHVTLELHDEPFGAGNARAPGRALRRRHRRHRQLRDALSRERRVRDDEDAERLRQRLPLRRAGVGVRGRDGPCYRCLHPEPPPAGLIPNCAEAGVLGVLPGIIGTIQATEAIKLLTGIGEPLVGRLLLYDALRMRFRADHAAARSGLSGLRRRARRFASSSPTISVCGPARGPRTSDRR